MRRKFTLFASVLFLAAAQNAFPIGRIGNSARIGDSKDLYSMPVPTAFMSISDSVKGSVRLDSEFSAPFPGSTIKIEALPLRTEYPQFRNMTHNDVREFLATSSKTVYTEISTSNGALTMIGENDSSIVGISVCEGVRGYVLLAKKFEMTKNAIIELLNKTEYEGQCSK